MVEGEEYLEVNPASLRTRAFVEDPTPQSLEMRRQTFVGVWRRRCA
jgi:hypothetical protein